MTPTPVPSPTPVLVEVVNSATSAADWVTAIGTILAVVVAAGAAVWSARIAQQERRARVDADERLLAFEAAAREDAEKSQARRVVVSVDYAKDETLVGTVYAWQVFIWNMSDAPVTNVSVRISGAQRHPDDPADPGAFEAFAPVVLPHVIRAVHVVNVHQAVLAYDSAPRKQPRPYVESFTFTDAALRIWTRGSDGFLYPGLTDGPTEAATGM